MDRSDTSIFPEAYVSALCARALPVSRGRGALERNAGGKERANYQMFFAEFCDQYSGQISGGQSPVLEEAGVVGMGFNQSWVKV